MSEEKSLPQWIADLIENGVSEGERNKTRFKLMLHLRNIGFKDAEIAEMILKFNENCNPPDLNPIVRNHIRYTLKHTSDIDFSQNKKMALVEFLNDGKLKNGYEYIRNEQLEIYEEWAIELETLGYAKIIEVFLEENFTPKILELDIKQFYEGKDLMPHLLGNHMLLKYKFLTLKDNEEMYIYKDGIYENSGEVFINNYCKKNIPKITEHQVSEVIFHIKSLSYKDRDDINSTKGMVWVRNGIVDVKSGSLIDFDSNLISTIKLPVIYDKGAECPNFKKFLSEVVTEGDISVLQEWGGYCLLNDYRFHKALMLIGSGSNGKSTFLNVNQKFLGEKNTCSVSLSELSYNRFAPSRLYGKIANIFADIPATRLLFTGNFKMATGEDRLPYEKKHRDSGEFRNTAKQMYSANQLPQTDDVTDAFFRRWIIIKFPNIFDQSTADKELLEKLTNEEELSGILNYYLEGLKRLLENGNFSYSKTQEEVKAQYIMLSDSIRAFAIACLEKTDIEHYITVDNLFEKYQDYCDENGLEIKTKGLVGRELPTILPFVHRGHTKNDGHDVRVWFNLKFKDTDSTENKTIRYNILSQLPFNNKNKRTICTQDNIIEEEGMNDISDDFLD